MDKSLKTPAPDILDFTDTAKQMDALKAIIFNATETTNANLQFIKEELSENRYQIKSNHIVDKLLEHVLVVNEIEIA